MKLYTAHLHPTRPPALLPDRFSWAAFLFGPLWLLLHAAWLPALLLFAAELALGALHGPAASAVTLGLAWLVGLHAQDLRGWSLRRRGFRLAHVVAAADRDSAYASLLAADPALMAQAAAR